jgi:homopolymeric O-antigen transport system permease protein
VFVLCGLVPFNFFALAWSTGTSSLLENYSIVKRVPVPREIVPIATVLGNCVHLWIQVALLLVFTVTFGLGVNRYWLWLPFVWAMEVIFVSGLTLISSSVNVYVRDTRYVVESLNALLFWVVPIFYPFPPPDASFAQIYWYNPLAALVLALRNILMDGIPPPPSLLMKLSFGSLLALAAGLLVFHRLKRNFYDYL